VTRKEGQFIGFILASDGLWDVITADQAATIAMRAYLKNANGAANGANGGGEPYLSPAEALVKSAIHSASDNVTAITVFFDSIGVEPSIC